MQYLNAVERLHLLHYAVNRNDFDLLLQICKEAIHGCSNINKWHLKNLKQTLPGTREELEKNGIFMCQNNLNIRQSVHETGESTFMKDPEIVGWSRIHDLKNQLLKNGFLKGQDRQSADPNCLI